MEKTYFKDHAGVASKPATETDSSTSDRVANVPSSSKGKGRDKSPKKSPKKSSQKQVGFHDKFRRIVPNSG